MDLNYITNIEQQNEELKKKLADYERALENSKSNEARRRYELTFTNRSGDDDFSYLVNFYDDTVINDKKDFLKQLIVEKMHLFNLKQIEINEIIVECKYFYDSTVIRWTLEMYLQKDWKYYAFRIPGRDTNMIIKDTLVDWLNDELYNLTTKEQNEKRTHTNT